MGGARKPQRMHFAAQRELRNWTQVQAAVKVFIIHHVVKRKARVLARRGQALQEGSMARVIGILVAAPVGIARAQPGLQNFDRRLPSSLADECAGMLRETAPGAGLHRAPNEKIELACIRGVEDVSVVRTPRRNLNLTQVSGSERRRTIVGLKHERAMINVSEGEHPQLARASR